MIAGRDGFRLVRENPPILVCSDFQGQSLADEANCGTRAIIDRCVALLALWRHELWPVLHLKRIAQAAWTDPSSQRADWVAGFQPRPGEMVFEHLLPSAYSAARFAEYMASLRNAHCLVAGCSLDETILATVVEGYHRGHRFCVADDAVLCGCRAGEPGYLMSIVVAAGKFARLARSGDVMAAASSRDLRDARP